MGNGASGALCFKTKKWTCSWKQYPKAVEDNRRYLVSGDLNNIATKSEVPKVHETQKYWSGSVIAPDNDSFVIGDTPIPIGATVSWKINVTCKFCCFNCNVGVTATDRSYSAYINCFDCSIRSGSSTYELFSRFDLEVDRKLKYDYQLVLKIDKGAGNPIGVVVDTKKREVSFVVENVVFGTVPNIPLDKPLVPLVFLGDKGDSAELIT